MKDLLRSVIAITGALLFLLIVGFLEIRAEAADIGAVVGLDNQLEAVTDQRSPALESAAAALAAAVMILAFYRRPESARRSAAAPALAAAAVLLLLGAWLMLTTEHPYGVGIDIGRESAEHPLLATARAGAHSSATHVVAVLLALIGAARLRGSRTGADREPRS